MIFMTMSLFAITGGKLLSYSLPQWHQILSGFTFPPTRQKRLFGYILFGFLGFIIAKKTLKFNHDIFDILVYAALIRLIIVRMGCLVGGCCYGIPTNSDWGIRYAGNFPAYHEQLHDGVISSQATHSLFVHPTQFYEIIVAIIVLVLIYQAKRNRLFSKNINLLFLAVILYGVFRFCIEFLRSGGVFHDGLKNIQWGILALIGILTIFIIISEKSGLKASDKSITEEKQRLLTMLTGFGLLTVITSLGPWMSPFEWMICCFIFFSVAIGILFQFPHLKSPYQYLKYATLLTLLPLFLLSQKTETPGDSLKTMENHFSLGFGGMAGREKQICGGYHEYQSAGVDVGYHFSDQNNGSHSVSLELYGINYENKKFFGLAPYYEYRRKYIALGGGVNISGYRSNNKDRDVYPKLNLRLGRQDLFFIDGRVSNNFPSGLPVIQIGLGFGGPFKTNNFYNNYFRLGISESGFYINPRLCFNKFLFDPFIILGDKENFQIALRFHILFNQ